MKQRISLCLGDIARCAFTSYLDSYRFTRALPGTYPSPLNQFQGAPPSYRDSTFDPGPGKNELRRELLTGVRMTPKRWH